MISNAKLRAAIPALNDIDAGVICDMEARAVAYVERQTNRNFGSASDITEYLVGRGTESLRLSESALDLDDIEVVERHGGTSAAVDSAILEVRDAERNSLLVRIDGSTWTRDYEYRVSYRRGYTEDHAPKDIERLVIGIVEFDAKFIGKAGMRSESIGGYSYTRFGDGNLLDDIPGARETILAWRRPVFA